MKKAIEVIIKEIVTVTRPSKTFNAIRNQADLTRSDSLALAAIPEARIPRTKQKDNISPSSPGQHMIKNAHETMFKDRLHNRGFSTSSRVLSEWPKSITDLGPSEEVMNELKREQVEKRGRTEEERKKLEDDLTSFASSHLKFAHICRRFRAADFIRAMTEGKVESTDEKYERLVRSFLNQNEERTKEMLEGIGWKKVSFLLQVGFIQKSMQIKEEMQQALFQYKPETPSEKRPIHAIATTDLYGEFDNKHLRDFGEDIAVFFDRDRLEGVSTVVGNDSITLVSEDHSGSVKIIASPEPLANPTHNIFPLEVETETDHQPDGTQGKLWDPSEHFGDPRSMPIRYFEVHIHRMLMDETEPLGPQHMTRVVIGDPISLGKDKAREVKELCDRYKIPCDIGKNKEHSKQLREDHPWIGDVFGKKNLSHQG